MSKLIWDKFSDKEKDEYRNFLKIFGALSGLFKDIKEGENAKKPYLYYRNHEQLFVRVFDVEDLTRKDGAFDALGIFGGMRVGIGLKTWIHSSDRTYQKVAEFNKLAPTELDPLIKNGNPEDVVRKVSELRNERIMLDKRLHRTDVDVYHFITRDDNVMNIVETPYDLIDIETLEFIRTNGKVYLFKDKLHNYKFYKSKSVLLEEFDASRAEILETIPIVQYDDPFELIKMIQIPGMDREIIEVKNIDEESELQINIINEQSEDIYGRFENQDDINKVIYLPLYQDKKEGRVVSECSGINIRHSKPKSKGSNTLRPEYEVEVRISKWIHHIFPKFFGIDALNDDEIHDKELNDFDLLLPDGRVLRGRVKQAGGKSLQTNPQSSLGEWILKDVLGIEKREEKVTLKLLNELGIDSLKITKIDDKHFKITVAETNAYEKFKLQNMGKILQDDSIKKKPYFRTEDMNELD
ncbi:NgoFVII family restriction endonuclease [Clostridium sp. AL.422]|uniref:NgoFVII family restriction endonuclease n=1 Tax=Clostridium TaxID=1485 RepID=UPI00293DBBDA|nr:MULTISPECIES: NgoFVII family restriction endonuclease [unclassified Clostridium]MDV4152124.1 NgoFVII family restriction endonuclease [Clostridium sp. AL.422]